MAKGLHLQRLHLHVINGLSALYMYANHIIVIFLCDQFFAL